MNNLKQEAEKIVKNLCLLEILSELGEAKVVGSIALDLMVKPDIDIHVLLKENLTLEDATRIACEELADFNKVRCIPQKYDNSIKIGIEDYRGENFTWSIDLWLTKNPSTTGFKLTNYLNKNLTDEQRQIIIELKTHFYKQGRLRDGLSAKIYQAVIEQAIKTPTDFEIFLQNLPEEATDEWINKITKA